MTFSRTCSRLGAVLAACALFLAPLTADDPEEELRSAVVLSFLRYTTWKSPLPAGGALAVGVLGRASLHKALQRRLEGKSVDNRVIHVVEVKSAAEPCHCQAIYIAINKRADVQQALKTARAVRALTIGESEKFLEYGGAVNLLVIDDQMSFEVSMEALEEGGIDISSRLLRLGQVRRKRPA